MDDIIAKADLVYRENHPLRIKFGRCIFLSWYCELGTCRFCFRSTIKHKITHAKNAKRSVASIMTDAVIGKQMGWPIEFLTGGYGIFEFPEIVDIAKKVSEIYGEKIWINLGALDREMLEKLKPYVEGVCASIETPEKERHDYLCPDKPIEPYEEMLELAKEMGFKRSITIVVGLEEKPEDIEILHDFIEKHNLERITFYALKPVQGSGFSKSPENEYYAWWIAKTRIRFPKLEIVAGLTPKNPDYTRLVVRAGANTLTKFPVLKKFNSPETQLIEKMVNDEGREFIGHLNELPDVDIHAEVDKLSFDDELKEKMHEKVEQYLRKIR
ncbi:MAG: radical SAM protein [Candidatus Nanoarchaeia archaeon]